MPKTSRGYVAAHHPRISPQRGASRLPPPNPKPRNKIECHRGGVGYLGVAVVYVGGVAAVVYLVEGVCERCRCCGVSKATFLMRNPLRCFREKRVKGFFYDSMTRGSASSLLKPGSLKCNKRTQLLLVSGGLLAAKTLSLQHTAGIAASSDSVMISSAIWA